MRIIAGEFRGRKLLSPSGDQTRPVTDRVKQSIFDILAPELPDARVYDCFAGTGSFGLESASRGAAHVTFFEMHRPTARILQTNIDTLKINDRSTIVSADLFKWLETTPPPGDVGVIFFDPPYRFVRERWSDVRSAIDRLLLHLGDDGTLAFRHDAIDQPDTRDVEFDVRDYGSMTLRLLRDNRVR